MSAGSMLKRFVRSLTPGGKVIILKNLLRWSEVSTEDDRDSTRLVNRLSP
jgi:hypothetical protein